MESKPVVTHDVCPRKMRTGSRGPQHTSMTWAVQAQPRLWWVQESYARGGLRRAKPQTPPREHPHKEGPWKPRRARCRVGRPGLATLKSCTRQSYPGISTVTGKGHQLGSLLRQVGTELEQSASFVCRAQ